MVRSAMDDIHVLVTISNAKGQGYILKLSVGANVMKVILTDKTSAEKWRCVYDANYIENLTRKTGNFKQFKVFVAMLRAGLLKTNECVFVELLNQEDLEGRRKKGPRQTWESMRNRKYLILVYQVEFDKIHYPLQLEYCGRPDPGILQTTVRRLEQELSSLRQELAQERRRNEEQLIEREEPLRSLVEKLNEENARLYAEIGKLAKSREEEGPRGRNRSSLELRNERIAFLDRIYRLEIENRKLTSLLSGRGLWSRSPVLRQSSARTSRPGGKTSLSLESLLSIIDSKKHSSDSSLQTSRNHSSASKATISAKTDGKETKNRKSRSSERSTSPQRTNFKPKTKKSTR